MRRRRSGHAAASRFAAVGMAAVPALAGRMLAAGFMLAAGLMLAACGTRPDSADPGGAVKQLSAAIYPDKTYANEEEQWDAELQERNSVDAAFCEDVASFACDTASLLLREENGNGIYSPLSLYYALALAAAGAQGETQDQILDALHSGDMETLSASAQKMFEIFYRDEDGYRFRMASSVWFDDSLSLKDAYRTTAAEVFYADLFQGEMGTADMKNAMETWVQEHTGGQIRPEIKTENILLHLLNTVDYYVEWTNQFMREKTEEDDFTLAGGGTVRCDFMNRISEGTFSRGDGYLTSGLSTKNGEVQFILPDEGVDLHEFLESPERLRTVLETGENISSYGEITWKVPKFAYGCSYNLNDMLKDLGIEKAFTREAEFTGISDTALWIDTATQMTHVGLNEDGVEAAAFTDLAMTGAAMPQEKAEMILNRPFLFVIRDRYCGYVPIFIGVCMDPSQES